MRDSLSITPTHSLGASSATFLIDQLKIATYFDLDHWLPTSAGRSVIAARLLVGLAQGAGEDSLPPDQRFYGGGSASIRGLRLPGRRAQFSGYQLSHRRNGAARGRHRVPPAIRSEFRRGVLRRRGSGEQHVDSGAEQYLRRCRGGRALLHAHRAHPAWTWPSRPSLPPSIIRVSRSTSGSGRRSDVA